MVPDLRVGGRELAAVGKRGFHRRVAVALEQGDFQTALGERVGGGDTGDAAADDGDRLLLHVKSSKRQRVECATQHARHTPPLFGT